jgi:hypothetical protein
MIIKTLVYLIGNRVVAQWHSSKHWCGVWITWYALLQLPATAWDLVQSVRVTQMLLDLQSLLCQAIQKAGTINATEYCSTCPLPELDVHMVCVTRTWGSR